MNKKIMLLGSGELGKEFTIACKRLGQYVVACDSYNDAPAMQVADEREVFSRKLIKINPGEMEKVTVTPDQINGASGVTVRVD